MSEMDYESLKAHLGHRVVVVSYGNSDVWNVAVECENCNEVLLDYDNPEIEKHYGVSTDMEFERQKGEQT